MKSVRERYLTDVHFHTLVDMMVSQIEQCQYTPSEMREAAILASIIYNEMHVSTLKQLSTFTIINQWLNSKEDK